MKSFYKEAIKSIKTSGTVVQSSKYLIQSCLKDLDLENSKTILEFGAGDGCITEQILKRKNSAAMLYSFEINPHFYEFCTQKFMSQEKIEIIKQSALEFDIFLKKNTINEVDYIISSLPLALFPESEVKLFLNKVGEHLKEGGIFVQYQYSLDKYKLLKEHFKSVKVNFILRNVPPAFVYRCYKN